MKYLTFTIPLPPPINQTYKIANNRMYKSQTAKAWQEEAGWVFKGNKLKGEIAVTVWMYLKRDRDIDSSLKLVLDTLADVGVYENDKQVKSLLVIKMIDKAKPRMELEVAQLNGSE